MKAPFPYFGGKRLIANLVWEALGDCDNYIEPFAGSLAVLLERPPWHKKLTETVNDADWYIENFWRAVTTDPKSVAAYADWPVNEAALSARHLWLVNEGRDRIATIESDPDSFDVKVAGWWVWGISAWIGSNWCSGTGPWKNGDAEQGVSRKRPHLADSGRGINRKLPHLANAGKGINRHLPPLPKPATTGQPPPAGVPGVHIPTSTTQPLIDYFTQLAERLRGVRVCCGDWSRVVTPGALDYGNTAGIFLDPPYSGEVRTKDLYATDDHDVSHAVREWAVANGDNPKYRIVLAGYAEEHLNLMPGSWRVHRYSASRSYGSGGGGGVNEANRRKECLWFSPHCVASEQGMFDFGS